MKSFGLSSVALLATTASASTVSLTTTRCLESQYQLQQFSVELDTAAPVPIDLEQVCGLSIVSASSNILINSITCQAFRDAAGTQPGSAVFTYTDPALIATNPIQEQAVWCNVTTASTSTSGGSTLARRQEEGGNSSVAVTSMATATATEVVSTPTSLILQTITASNTTATSTAVVATSGMPSGSVNVTTVFSTTGQPSASASASDSDGASATTKTIEPSGTGNAAAGQVGVGMGALGAVVAAMVL